MANDYDTMAEATRAILLARLSEKSPSAQRFAIICLVALAKDGKIGDLLYEPEKASAR